MAIGLTHVGPGFLGGLADGLSKMKERQMKQQQLALQQSALDQEGRLADRSAGIEQDRLDLGRDTLGFNMARDYFGYGEEGAIESRGFRREFDEEIEARFAAERSLVDLTPQAPDARGYDGGQYIGPSGSF